ncbi:MAG: sodium-dependent transporter [Oscillospiraceae bacterium]
MEKTKQAKGFSTPLVMALSMIAASVGTGNIWRFPRVAASNGGAAFIIAYILIMVVAVIPLMMGEHIIGRATRKGLPGAFRDFMGNKKATWLGSFVEWVVIITIAYYTVVVAWIFYYLYLTITGGCFVADKAGLFDSVSNGNMTIVVIYVLIQVFCAWGAYKGVKFIEKSTQILLPALFLCVIVLAIRTVTLPGATAGLNFLFDLNPADLLHSKVWLEALTQCFWSAGPGWGICIAYGVYSKRKSDVALSSTVQGLGDMSVALLAGVAIIPALFSALGQEGALEACASGNNGLAFIALTGVFEQMPGGRLFASLFWIALICASVTSIIAMYSIVVQPLADAGVKKKKSIVIMAVGTIVIGIPSCWSINFFNNQDFVVGMGMVIGAVFSCIALRKFGASKVRNKLLNNPYTGLRMGKWWEYGATIICPIVAIAMFAWWCVLSVGWNPDWYNPFGTYSLATMVLQLGGVGVIMAIFNNRIAKSAGKKEFNGEDFPEIVDNGFN